jgi:hypothetical protein
LSVLAVACTFQPGDQKDPQNAKPRQALFVGLDVSGSFHRSGYYDNALAFLAHYLYGHLNELGGLIKPRDLFVAAIGGQGENDPKAFHPIHDFAGKDIPQIEASLREWFPSNDKITDFNAYFKQVARIAKERNLLLAPITVMVVSDGIPDVPGQALKPGSLALYTQIDLSPLDYLSKNVTVRLTYASPKVGDKWRTHVPRDRVRLWTVEAEVMKGWQNQMQGGADLPAQQRLWKWMRDNVDYRVRSQAL